MTIYVDVRADYVLLRARAEGDGGLVGDAAWAVRPGGAMFGVPYAWWAAHPGAVDLETAQREAGSDPPA